MLEMRRISKTFAGTKALRDRKSTRLNSSHSQISYAVFCLKKKKLAYPLDRDPLFTTADLHRRRPRGLHVCPGARALRPASGQRRQGHPAVAGHLTDPTLIT